MSDKKYSLGKKEMSIRELEEAQTRPYKNLKGRRYELPPTGESTYVGLGSSEYGGYEAGAGRGLPIGMTAAQARSKSVKNAERDGTYIYKPVSERVKDKEMTKQTDADTTEQNVIRARYAKGGKASSVSSRGDGIAQRGKTRGKMV